MSPSLNNNGNIVPQIVDCPNLNTRCTIAMTMIASKSTMSSVISHAPDILPAAAADHNPSKPAPLKPLMSNKSTANRFTAAQRDRTLRHHKLLQPTSSQEKLHLSRLRAERQIEHRCSSSVSLLTLPEEEDEQLQDHVQFVYKQASSIDEDRVVQEMCYSFKSSLSTATASTTSMSDSQRSISDEDDSDHEEDEYIVSSPFPSQLKSSHSICQPCEMYPHSHSHRFVVCADTQFGIIRGNTDWDAEIQYSNRAIDLINEMEPRPAFVCVCGDLVDMEFSLERKKGCKSKFPSSLFNGEAGELSRVDSGLKIMCTSLTPLLSFTKALHREKSVTRYKTSRTRTLRESGREYTLISLSYAYAATMMSAIGPLLDLYLALELPTAMNILAFG
jgi:hypothetical protein